MCLSGLYQTGAGKQWLKSMGRGVCPSVWPHHASVYGHCLCVYWHSCKFTNFLYIHTKTVCITWLSFYSAVI